MEILGVGAPELIFIVIIVILILGPKDMEKAGLTIGRWLNKLIRSDSWFLFQKTSHELRNLPTNLMRAANNEIARTEQDIRKELDAQFLRTHASPATSEPVIIDTPSQTIQPPEPEKPRPVTHPKPTKPGPKKKAAVKKKTTK
jgi:Sec-independent protein translocase protein TatA